MPRTQDFEVLDKFENEHYFLPSKDWPEYEFQYQSTCRWVLNQIREYMARKANEHKSMTDILEELYWIFDTGIAECCEMYDEKNEIKAWQYPPPDIVFSVGRAMVEEVAGLYL